MFIVRVYICIYRRLDEEDKENLISDNLALQAFHSKKSSAGKSN
jgi:hypothetical protein